jgi:hypothetical protein
MNGTDPLAFMCRPEFMWVRRLRVAKSGCVPRFGLSWGLQPRSVREFPERENRADRFDERHPYQPFEPIDRHPDGPAGFHVD